jgi:hypothetical protein
MKYILERSITHSVPTDRCTKSFQFLVSKKNSTFRELDFSASTYERVGSDTLSYVRQKELLLITRQPVLFQLFLFEHKTNQVQRHSKSKPCRTVQSDSYGNPSKVLSKERICWWKTLRPTVAPVMTFLLCIQNVPGSRPGHYINCSDWRTRISCQFSVNSSTVTFTTIVVWRSLAKSTFLDFVRRLFWFFVLCLWSDLSEIKLF